MVVLKLKPIKIYSEHHEERQPALVIEGKSSCPMGQASADWKSAFGN